MSIVPSRFLILTKVPLSLFLAVTFNRLTKARALSVEYVPCVACYSPSDLDAKLLLKQKSRHQIAVAGDLVTFAVAGTDGSIHVYDWESRKKTTERAVISYHRSYLEARPITLSFVFGSRFLMLGGEEEVATIMEIGSKQQVASFHHQSEFYYDILRYLLICLQRVATSMRLQ